MSSPRIHRTSGPAETHASLSSGTLDARSAATSLRRFCHNARHAVAQVSECAVRQRTTTTHKGVWSTCTFDVSSTCATSNSRARVASSALCLFTWGRRWEGTAGGGTARPKTSRGVMSPTGRLLACNATYASGARTCGCSHRVDSFVRDHVHVFHPIPARITGIHAARQERMLWAVGR